jgi:hypothetical protein
MRTPSLFNLHWNHRNATRSALLAAVLVLLARPAQADESQCLRGSWQGTLKEAAGREVAITPVKLVLDALSEEPYNFNANVTPPPEAARQQIIFAPPLRCRLSLAFAGPHNDSKGPHYHLTMIDANGGKCSQLEGVQLRLQCTLEGSKLTAWYSYTRADKSEASAVFELTRSPPP